MDTGLQTAAEFPSKLECLFRPARYKVLYGGRGAGRSWGCARALEILATQKQIRVLCAREFQSSIAESVHKLLEDQIGLLGLTDHFIIEKASIRCPATGSEFFFEGIKHNTQKIKSYEGVDIAWVEEANLVTKTSWDILIPTIRRPGSEIWVTFNPDLETDYTYEFFVKNPPADAIVVKTSWRDNPWFSEEMNAARLDMKARDPDSYLNIWEGHCRVLLEGAVYAEEIRAALGEGRICHVPYEPLVPVDTWWDLGRSDATSIIFGQRVGFEDRIIDYYENRQKDLDHYLHYIQTRPYIYGSHFLPHDARAKTLVAKRSVEAQARDKLKSVRITPSLALFDGINAARTLWRTTWIDEKKCAKLIEALKHYHYKVEEINGRLSKLPVHDWSSHGADSFRYRGVAASSPREDAAPSFVDRMRNVKPFQRIRPAAAGMPSQHGWLRG